MPVTPFQQRVYDALREIPRGKVTTYGVLAAHIDCGSAQAVGQALRRNPFAPEVPCHRVVRTDLSIGGFSGETSGPAIQRKICALRGEGVRVADGHITDPGCVFRF